MAAHGAEEGRLLLLPYQSEVVASGARFTWSCWARQTGKSTALGLRRLLRGLLRRRTQVILSAGERQSREVMEKIRQMCGAIEAYAESTGEPFFQEMRQRRTELLMPGGVRVIGLPANPRTARGYSGDVFLDEFAMHRDDAAIWSALFPTLVRGAGELDVASTPHGQANLFHRLRSNDLFEHRLVTLEAAVGQGLEADLAELRRAMDDELAWRQEFCCEFLDEATSFLPYELIRRCQDAGLSTEVDWACLGRREAEVFAGVDVGRHRDVTVVWLWERTGGMFVTRGVQVLSQAAFLDQEAAVGRVLARPALRRCCIDATGLGMALAEGLAGRFGEHRVEAVTFNPPVKSELAGRLRVLAERGLLRIPAEGRIEADWHSMSRIVTRGGHVRFDAGHGGEGHGDRFWAAALGLAAAEGEVGRVEMIPGPGLVFGAAGAW
jgi:phage FluMu gp28-like protein